MLSEIPYGTFANYSPRGGSALSQKSRRICGAIKGGKTALIQSAARHISSPAGAPLQTFLNPEVTLVPVPRSAPLTQDALWPAEVIANILHGAGLGRGVLPCISRTKAVRKSSSSPSSERPLVHEHYESMSVEEQLVPPAQITLVDDVLTMGRTVFACALRLHEVYPDAEIRAFAVIRTLGFVPDIDAIMDPAAGTITYYQNSGKTHREP